MKVSNLHAVYDAMNTIAKHRGLSAVVLMLYQGELAVVEGFAHARAPQLEAGVDFESRLRSSSDEKANNHEAATPPHRGRGPGHTRRTRVPPKPVARGALAIGTSGADEGEPPAEQS